MCAQCLRHKDNSCSKQQETAKDIFSTVSQWLLALLFTSITSANLFYLSNSSFLTFILARFFLSCDDSEVRKTFLFFFLIFMCALWCGPINHIGVYPRLCRDELKLPHNSGEVGGGSRTLRIITSEAEGSEKRDSGCDAEMSFPRLN